MFYKLFSILVIGVYGVTVLPFSGVAHAKVPLTKAEIHRLRNIVRLRLKQQSWRKAHRSDRMTPGDSLSTGKASLADLRFNDGSLARVGERAIFRFLPKTRRLSLSNGTVLLLIPPGRGGTRIRTPNAAAAIRGSALFVRYDKTTDTTIVGALTDSGIKVSNKNASQTQKLAAGQLLVIVKDRIVSFYDFDLRTFYETSDLVQDLDLTNSAKPNPDPAIASVQAEITDALATQKPLIGQEVKTNPSFIKLSAEPPSQKPGVPVAQDPSPIDIDARQLSSTQGANIKNNAINPASGVPQKSTTQSITPSPVTTTPQPATPQPTTSSPSKPSVIIKTPAVTPPTQPTQEVPTEPQPATPVPPTQEIPTEPQPATPVPPTQEIPTEPQPETPVPPTQEIPTEPQPATPVPPTQEIPTEPQPATPVPPTQEIPTQPEPATPVPPTQEVPEVELDYITAPSPTPEIPTQPEPATPVQPTREVPEVELDYITAPSPTPEIPTQPEPATPVPPTQEVPEVELDYITAPSPTPEIPTQPEPTTPVQPTREVPEVELDHITTPSPKMEASEMEKAPEMNVEPIVPSSTTDKTGI